MLVFVWFRGACRLPWRVLNALLSPYMVDDGMDETESIVWLSLLTGWRD